MSTTFVRSMRALWIDDPRRSMLAALVTLLFLGLWLIWFFLARVALYEMSAGARLEVDRAAHPVATPVAGRIVAAHLDIGRRIKAGEVLLEVDAASHELRLEEERARLQALEVQLTAIGQEIAAEKHLVTEARGAARVAVEEARKQREQADARTALADDVAQRTARLSEQGLVARADVVRAEAERHERRAGAQALQLGVQRLAKEWQAKERTHEAKLAQLHRQQALLVGERDRAATAALRLKEETDRYRIRAPIDGELGEVAMVRVGSVLNVGDRVGSILPHGTLRVVADFPPQALGRLRTGQTARVHLDGFPSTQYGHLSAKLTSVAAEIRDRHVRAELALRTDERAPIPLRHGQPGTVEVEVERVSPAVLVVRAVGGLFRAPSERPGAGPDAGSRGRQSAF